MNRTFFATVMLDLTPDQCSGLLARGARLYTELPNGESITASDQIRARIHEALRDEFGGEAASAVLVREA